MDHNRRVRRYLLRFGHKQIPVATLYLCRPSAGCSHNWKVDRQTGLWQLTSKMAKAFTDLSCLYIYAAGRGAFPYY